MDELVAVGELAVEGGGLEGGGRSDGRNFSIFRRGWGKLTTLLFCLVALLAAS